MSSETINNIGYYQSIESFALVDGPGVRSVLFLQGCPLRCLFCHNPDTFIFSKNNPITPLDAFNKLIKYKPYWQDNGGITISGGEPLSQIDFLLEFSKICKKNNISLVIDTAGYPFNRKEPYFSKFKELLMNVDLFLLDIKTLDRDEHIKLTGKDNDSILDLFSYLNEINFPIWIRRVLVPTINDSEKELYKEKDFISNLKNVKKVEVLPYHTLGIFKYEKLGIEYKLKDIKVPTAEEIKKAEDILSL